MNNTGNHIENNDYMGYDINASIDEKDFDTHDFKIDLSDLLDNGNDFQNTIEKHDINNSPGKKKNYIGFNNNYIDIDKNLPLKRVILPPISNDLFQVTNNSYRSPQKNQRNNFNFNFNNLLNDNDMDMDDYSSDYSEDNDFIASQKLRNDKMHKLVDNLSKTLANENPDYELDDQLRTRFYKGRFNKNQNPLVNSDPLDLQLEHYLSHSTNIHNENKENLSINNVSKYGRDTTLKRTNKGILKPPKRNSKIKSKNIPILKPLSNFPNVELQRMNEFSVKRLVGTINQERGSCVPNHRRSVSLKSSVKYSPKNIKIYIVDSSTGLINDATQFGTELNASNCEGFPLPEDVNEVVQIPTNEDSRPEKRKLAIIRLATNNTSHSNTDDSVICAPVGFYTKQAFHNYKQSTTNADSTDVQVVSQPTMHTSSSSNKGASKKVQWADELEW